MMRCGRGGRWFGVLVGACVLGSACCAFGQTGAAGKAVSKANAEPAFEVATIKPGAPSTDGHTHINYPEGGRFSASNITLLALMQWAYDMPQKQILDGPAWMGSERFDMAATSDAGTDARLRALPGEENVPTKKRMVQALLADRFALKVHRETRILPAYDLVVAKGGSKLQVSHADGKSIGTGRTHFNGEGLPMEIVAEQLSQIAGRVVVDKTELPDRYDLKLRWTPDDAPVQTDSPPSLFTAIEEQLGLKLVSSKEPVSVLVIDHIEQPSPN
ncbi:MAG: TIGR03435 family protein [Acidobacteriaceae bacterium]